MYAWIKTFDNSLHKEKSATHSPSPSRDEYTHSNSNDHVMHDTQTLLFVPNLSHNPFFLHMIDEYNNRRQKFLPLIQSIFFPSQWHQFSLERRPHNSRLSISASSLSRSRRSASSRDCSSILKIFPDQMINGWWVNEKTTCYLYSCRNSTHWSCPLLSQMNERWTTKILLPDCSRIWKAK
jgi:hypothetical protein